MRYTVTQFSVRSYPFEDGVFDKRFNEHFDEVHKGKELLQVWHSHKSQTGNADFDYYSILWRLLR